MVVDLPASAAEPVLSFGRFRLLPRQRLLLEGGKPLRVGSRALDILVALLERPGERVSRHELLAQVWPDTHVVEENLRFQVAALRKVLGDGRDGSRLIETSPGQGYRFVAPVVVTHEIATLPSAPDATADQHNLPRQLTSLIGREEVVAKLVNQLPRQRLLTLVGPGGIGKTSVALAVAERLIGDHEHGVWFVDFARLTDAARVWTTVASATGVKINPGADLASLAAALRNKRMLLVLNNCGHLVDAVASLAVGVLSGAPGIHILATSREPLRVEGEHLCRLGPLDSPTASAVISAAEALRFSAVQLFVARAMESFSGFELRDEDTAIVGEICRKLDGIPLALEFAAARVGILGLRGLATQLEDRLQVLTSGRRMALAPHRTMRAALDWSYDQLTEPERTLFRHLAIFAGGFTLAAAAAVISETSRSAGEVTAEVLDLAEKSLVAADMEDTEPRFRLLETTRAYALEKLRESDAIESVARRHAVYYLEVFEGLARSAWESQDGPAAFALEVDNLRVALAWAFGPRGDSTLGVKLAAASEPLWTLRSLLAEAHSWDEKAIRNLDAANLRASRQEMVLQAALGMSFLIAKGMTAEAHAALNRAFGLAEQLGDADYQLRLLNAFWVYHTRLGEVRDMLALARKAETLAASGNDRVATATADRMLGVALHCAGEHSSARMHLERFLREPPSASRGSYIQRFGFDQQVLVHYVLGHVLWVQGFPDQAVRIGRLAVQEARALRHPVTLCSALAWGGAALALRTGDAAVAREFAAELVDFATKQELADYRSYGLAVRNLLSLRSGVQGADVPEIYDVLCRWRASKWHVYLTMSDFVEVAARAGYVEEVAVILDETLERAEQNQEFWAFPEALRIKGELLLLQAKPDLCLAEDYFVRSLERGRAQGTPSWELRAAMSIARLDVTQGRTNRARDILARAYGLFKEGFDTADLRSAKQLLDDLGGAAAR